MRRTHSDYSRVQAAWADDSTRAAIETLLLQLADAPPGTTGRGRRSWRRLSNPTPARIGRPWWITSCTGRRGDEAPCVYGTREV